MQAIILAAGRGSRLAGHNPDGHPKCLMEFGGRSLLDRSLDLLYRLGVRQADLVIGYEAFQIVRNPIVVINHGALVRDAPTNAPVAEPISY